MFKRGALLFAFLFAVLRFVPLGAADFSVLATGDMHGWLEPEVSDGRFLGGAAETLALWKTREGYVPGSAKFLVLSSGDIATGPAISTCFKGESAVAVMNLMGYEASALGNHEFDFGGAPGVERFKAWAKFPLLAANLLEADGSRSKTLGGSALFVKDGVKIGVVGLTVRDLPSLTGRHSLKLEAYETSLRREVPALRSQGAKVVIALTHIPQADLCKLSKAVRDLSIDLMLGGHGHELAQQKIGGTWIVSSGCWWRAYSRVDFHVDDASGAVAVVDSEQVSVSGASSDAQADPALKAEVANWRARLAAELGEVVGYTASGLSKELLFRLATGAWLERLQPADLAMVNTGAFRQTIPPGPIRKADILGVLPFDNSLLRLSLGGAALQAYSNSKERVFYGGARRDATGVLLLDSTGLPLEPAKEYRVLMNSFLFGASPSLKASVKSSGAAASDWLAPLFDWLKAHPSDKDNPLEKMLTRGNP